MSTTTINKNIMNIFAEWLQENDYIKEKDDIDDESWDNLGEKIGCMVTDLKVKGKGDKVKDPDAPKRGKSAYIFFCAAFRKKVTDEIGSDATLAQVSKELGLRWGKLKESKKPADVKTFGVFNTEAATDKIRYQGEMENYVRPSDDELMTTSKKGKKGKKAKKDPNAPKRGKSAYIFFCSAKRPEVKEELGEDTKTTEITSRLGELWNELKADESRVDDMAVYEKLAADDKERYISEKEDYVSDESENDVTMKKKPVAKKPVAKKADVKKTDVKKGNKKPEVKKKVVKEPEADEEDLEEEEDDIEEEEDDIEEEEEEEETKNLSGYKKFCVQHQKELDGKNSKAENVKILAKMWKDLSKKEQGKW